MFNFRFLLLSLNIHAYDELLWRRREWGKLIWKPHIQPKISVFLWRLMHFHWTDSYENVELQGVFASLCAQLHLVRKKIPTCSYNVSLHNKSSTLESCFEIDLGRLRSFTLLIEYASKTKRFSRQVHEVFMGRVS